MGNAMAQFVGGLMQRNKDKAVASNKYLNGDAIDIKETLVPLRYLVNKFGKSRSYWYSLRKSGLGPAFIKLGHRSILYPLSSVERWMNSLMAVSLSDPNYRDREAERRLKREEEINEIDVKSQNAVAATKGRGIQGQTTTGAWTAERIRRSREPRFLVVEGDRSSKALQSASKTAHRIAARFLVDPRVAVGNFIFCN